ncbi:MAG: hypothetical protein LBF27_23500 [Sphingobacterium sp.]|jgi:hypothetical protein|nr:hypothetical protein [Sphingobacterium sp.]
MAQFFKEITNIDPLTISQTRHIERYYPQFETDEFLTINKFVSFSFSKPVVALKDDTAWHDDFVDISVFYPRYLTPNSRPGYLSNNNLTKPVQLDTHGQKGLFVQAYYADEKQGHRIPADQLFIKTTKEFLYLRPGNYILEFKNTNDQIVNTKRVSVRK